MFYSEACRDEQENDEESEDETSVSALPTVSALFQSMNVLEMKTKTFVSGILVRNFPMNNNLNP